MGPIAIEHLRGETARSRVAVATAFRAIDESDAYGEMTNAALQRLVTMERDLSGLAVYLSSPNQISESATSDLMRLLEELREQTRMIALIMHREEDQPR